MSDLVVYGNDFNFMPLPKLTENEMNFFMAIISELKENREIEFDFMDFAYDLHLKSNLSAMELQNIFYKLAEKMLNFKVKYKTKNKAYAFVCFERLCLDFCTNKIEIKAQEDFYELITNLQMGFTKFELKEFMSLGGKYTKTLYRLLKQFRNTGLLKIDWSEFCKIMDIPESYKQADIDKRILNPSIKELSAEPNLFTNEKQTIFKNLTYKKIKDPKGRGRGGKVIGIEFYFTPEPKRNELKEMIQNLARTEKEMEKNSGRETKFHILTGEEVTELTPYISRHFQLQNKEYG
uniref:replication initiation protein n=1 Tax=Campylobacter lanienae TaxID=75658 RepID=UPI000BB42AD0